MLDDSARPEVTGVKRLSWLRTPVVLAVGLTLGFGLARLAFIDEGTGDPSASAPRRETPVTLPDVATVAVPAAGAAAADPGAAVESFLQAEAATDFTASWSLLAAEDRARYGSVAGWVAAHEAIAPVTGFVVETPTADGEVPALLQLRAGLDGVLGLVPARATSTWQAVAEDGGWRVAFGRSELVPVLPSDDGVVEAAVAWYAARQSCETAPVAQHGALVGVTGLAERLCGIDEPTAASAVGRLSAADSTRFVSAFGPDVVEWARVVDLDGPAPLRAVLAPIGDDWRVVGVLPPTP